MPEAGSNSTHVAGNGHAGHDSPSAPSAAPSEPARPAPALNGSGAKAREPRPPNPEFHGRLKKRLSENGEALAYLAARGVSARTVEHFGLGLSAPYVSRKSGLERSDALIYPVVGRSGKFLNKYGYYGIDGVTKNPEAEAGWMSGEARVYYSDGADGRKNVFVCEGVWDVWSNWQALATAAPGADLLFITSTHAAEFPDEWKTPEFWSDWDAIYLGHSNSAAGDALANKLAALTGREARRVVIPPSLGRTWADFWRHSKDGFNEFNELLGSANFISVRVNMEDDDGTCPGRFAYGPVNINGAFHNGHLYYTVRILNRSVDVEHKDSGEGIVRQVERLETVVVKSDRTVHTTVMTPAPKGTRFEDRVMRLTDGTLIDRAPTPNRYGSWSWHSIKAYLEGATKTRGLGAILRDVSAHLRSSVWLPHEEDYAILTLVVPVTYAQAIFDSVPLIFLHGPPGSGKSETGRAMARVAANAYVCGQSSAASIARFIDESRGFVVLDDLEAISSRGGEFSELSQALKLSYNRETAVKLWTDVKTMRTMRLNFFGVKMVNNTQGADHTLGSRMMRIQAQPIPDRIKEQFLGLAPTESSKLKALRDELHTWTFVNVALIEEEYRKLFPKNSDRACEIAAPLKVMASLADDPELRSMLDLALMRQDRKSLDVDDPVKVMREAVKNLIAQGYETVSITHVVLEMRYILSHAFGRSYLDAVPDWAQAEWAGRKLRSEGLIESGEACARRIRVWGSNLRFYRVSRRHIDKVKASLAGEHIKPPAGVKDPQDFCRTCETCQYRSLSCEIMVRRTRGRPEY